VLEGELHPLQSFETELVKKIHNFLSLPFWVDFIETKKQNSTRGIIIP
jgi:hypothetical protein